MVVKILLIKQKNDEKVRSAIDKISKLIAENVDELKSLAAREEITLDCLENLMGELKSKNNEIIEKLYSDFSSNIIEREMIRKKKTS